jgi:hypothetical protein
VQRVGQGTGAPLRCEEYPAGRCAAPRPPLEFSVAGIGLAAGISGRWRRI